MSANTFADCHRILEEALMERCTRCIIPSCFPGAELDEQGVCNHCVRHDHELSRKEESRRKFEGRFAELLETVPREGNYDCLVAYSGGKDSSYTLISMKQRFGLKVLAFTFDNGFLPETTLQNIMKVVEGVGVDYVLVKPDFSLMKRIFVAAATTSLYPRKTVERASTICTSCIAFVKFASLRTAIEQSIPFMTFGWSPGQVSGSSPIFKTNPMIIRSMQKVLYRPLHEVAGDAINPYFLEDKHFENPKAFPYSISPLSFMEYDEDRVLREISAYGWRRPEEVDPNSTNCLINSFANRLHFEQYGYNPYVFELAKLVREGYLKRDEALQRVEHPGDQVTTELVRKRLGLPPAGC
jgi:tRNA(Ile)-lysidine synthase TilS/MesJ